MTRLRRAHLCTGAREIPGYGPSETSKTDADGDRAVDCLICLNKLELTTRAGDAWVGHHTNESRPG